MLDTTAFIHYLVDNTNCNDIASFNLQRLINMWNDLVDKIPSIFLPTMNKVDDGLYFSWENNKMTIVLHYQNNGKYNWFYKSTEDNIEHSIYCSYSSCIPVRLVKIFQLLI